MRSHDIIFLEDQMIDDFEKPNKPKSTSSSPVDLCPYTSLRSLNNGGVTTDDGTHVTRLRRGQVVFKLSRMHNHLYRRSEDP